MMIKSGDNLRMTHTTLQVLAAFMEENGELTGADLLNQRRMFSGTLYPILYRLEKAGWLEGRWEDVDPSEVKRPRRRYYRLTGLGQRAGRAALAKRSGWSGDGDFAPA